MEQSEQQNDYPSICCYFVRKKGFCSQSIIHEMDGISKSAVEWCIANEYLVSAGKTCENFLSRTGIQCGSLNTVVMFSMVLVCVTILAAVFCRLGILTREIWLSL